MFNIFWFRRDLRLNDNTALHFALETNNKTLPIFIFDSNIINELPKDDARVLFIFTTLQQLNQQLKQWNSSIKIYIGDPETIWQQIISETNIASVYINEDYEPYAIKRDTAIAEILKTKNIQLHLYKDQVVFAKNEIVKNDGKPYTVFTPYKNKWMEKFTENKPNQLINSKLNNLLHCSFSIPELHQIGFVHSEIQVKPFTLDHIENYAELRNFPAQDAGSYLSTHLRFGTVSIRKIIAQAEKSPVFLSELIWREFFMQILFHYPRVVLNNFHAKFNSIVWRNNLDEFEKWKNGETGYPLVDAGMKQLNTTGYMHNRVRMLTAAFLCKHLLIDWRWGEAYFAKKLLDYELASNNGNWQWAASTGCDAVPYFRIFNPYEQHKKFDINSEYINTWLPNFNSNSYPSPIVEHKFARQRALDEYAKATATNSPI